MSTRWTLVVVITLLTAAIIRMPSPVAAQSSADRVQSQHISGPAFRQPRSGSYPGTWKGSFIWDQKDTVPYNHHLMFRKTFRAGSLPAGARIHITASDKYRLFVNGTYVGRGPARNAGPFWTSYDTHDVTRLIREDNNTIAVHGYYYGCPTVWSADMPPGLWVEAEMLNADG